MKELFQALQSKLKEGHDGVLATIVASSGSTPRGEGAHMVVTRAGRLCGTIGGGAVEHQGELVAQEVLDSKASHIEHFRLRPNQIQDLGMICGGDVDVHFQYIPANHRSIELLEKIAVLYEQKKEFWLVLDIAGEDSELGVGGMAVHTECELAAIDNRKFYCEKMLLSGNVYIFGGGHVSQALVPVLAAVGFRCIVLEDREEFCHRELFPGVEDTILILNDKIADYVEIDEEDYVCIMTRGHKDDLTVQAQVLGTPASYIGVIGSRAKKASVFAKLKEQGFTDTDLERVTTPIGLDIGAETPAEIAVSIAAQLIANRAGR